EERAPAAQAADAGMRIAQEILDNGGAEVLRELAEDT
ncbi:MAG: hydroxymethylbilane synthase, partial [bacterium]|nr:hydroxymethylbilane synthase [bacterium]